MILFKKIIFYVLFCAVFLSSFSFAFAQEKTSTQNGEFTPPKEEVVKAKVIEIIDDGEVTVSNYSNPYQTVKIKLLDGIDKNKEVVIKHGKTSTIRKEQKVSVGETVVVKKYISPQKTEYQIIDTYRLNTLLYLAIVFFLLIIALSRWKGIGSIIGLVISFGVITLYIIPQILSGEDPLLVSIVGSVIILTTTIYLAHGFSKKTSIALFATCASLLLSGILAVFFVYLAKLTGFGNDDVYSLQFGQTQTINARGLLLGGIIIGSLGVLDDITTSLTTAIFELAKANPALTMKKLAKSAFVIGNEHISSLVNTLVLAYAGAALPLFLFIVLNPTNQPLWVIINSELIAEEIVRSLSGSIGLVLAVPITILLAVAIVKRSP